MSSQPACISSSQRRHGGRRCLETRRRSVRRWVRAGQTSGEILLDVAKESKTEGKVSKSWLTLQRLGKTHATNRGTVLYLFVPNRSLPQNCISRERRRVTNSNFSCFSRDQGSCSSFPRLNTAKSMWLNKQYRSFIMSNWFLITTADNPLVKLPVMCSWTARRQDTPVFNKPVTCLTHLLISQ